MGEAVDTLLDQPLRVGEVEDVGDRPKAMAVGGAEVDAGGRFEALIGLGYVIGPLAVMFCDESKGQLVGATWAAAMLGLVPALAPWFAWRRRQAKLAGVVA